MNYVFLISQPRSGSTLLQRLLHEHSDIATTGEPWFLLPALKGDLDFKVVGKTTYDAKLANKAIQEFVLGNSMDEHRKTCYLNLYKSICVEITKRQSSKIFLDKTPRYYLIISELRRAFPSAKIVILTRNPMDVFNSILNTWVKKSYGSLAQHKQDLFLAPKLLSEELEKSKAYHIKYEDLISNPRKAMVSLCAFLNIDYDDNLMLINGNKDWLLGDPKMNDLKNVDSTKKDQWLEGLTPQKWRFYSDYINSAEAEYHKALGYGIEDYQMQLKKNRPNKLALLFTIDLSFYMSGFARLILSPVHKKLRIYKTKLKSIGFK